MQFQFPGEQTSPLMAATISFNLKLVSFNTKYFNSVDLTRITHALRKLSCYHDVDVQSSWDLTRFT